MRLPVVTLTLLLALPWPAAAQSAPAPEFQPREESESDYPDHPGRALAFDYCVACHGFRIVASQGMTREQWDGSLNWMTERHKMPAIESSDRILILDYLETAFPPKAPAAGRPGWRSPFAPQ